MGDKKPGKGKKSKSDKGTTQRRQGETSTRNDGFI